MDGVKALRFKGFIASMASDHDFTTWQTFEALKTLYIYPIS